MAAESLHAVTYRLIRLVEVDYPREYLGWYLGTGNARKDPIFQECVRTKKPQVACEVIERFRNRFEAEYLQKIEEFHLEYEIQGVTIGEDQAGHFLFILNNYDEAKACLPILERLMPSTFQGLTASYQYPVLTPHKQTILLWRAQGKRTREIADELGISERTVKMHLEEITKRLYARDLVNAVWIATQIGITG
jgi:DNA-binding CsgD family transcriptional regulator